MAIGDLITLPVRSYRSTDKLDKIILDCGERDLRFSIAAIFAREVEEQKALGNPPSNITVDNSASKPLSAVRRRAQAHFVRIDDIRRAAEDALRLVALLTRYKTGRARASISIYVGATEVRSIAAAVDRLGPDDVVVVAGPQVEYGRKLWYNPDGIAKFNKRTGRRKTIAAIAVPRLRSRHRGLYIAEHWIESSPLGRTPGIAIGMKRRGALQ